MRFSTRVLASHGQKIVTTALDAVLHAELQQANAGGSIRKRRFGMGDERKERTGKNERK
jgi:hypothetical protein